MASNKKTHSGVIVLHELLTDSFILTKRSHQLRHHAGEFCFPGGLWEKTDINYWNTALRELEEELGIVSSRVSLVKPLLMEMTLLGTIIHPWLATIESVEPFIINSSEVAELIRIPRIMVEKRENYQEITLIRKGHTFKSWQFITYPDLIWGATARIMKQLCTSE